MGQVPGPRLDHAPRRVEVDPEQEAQEGALHVVVDIGAVEDIEELVDAEDGLADGLDEAVFPLRGKTQPRVFAIVLPPIHTGCAGAYARRYARSVRGSKFAVFGALRLFRVRIMHACSDMVRNVVRECVARNCIWVSTPKICMTHDVVTGCGIPNKFKLFSNC